MRWEYSHRPPLKDAQEGLYPLPVGLRGSKPFVRPLVRRGGNTAMRWCDRPNAARFHTGDPNAFVTNGLPIYWRFAFFDWARAAVGARDALVGRATYMPSSARGDLSVGDLGDLYLCPPAPEYGKVQAVVEGQTTLALASIWEPLGQSMCRQSAKPSCRSIGSDPHLRRVRRGQWAVKSGHSKDDRTRLIWHFGEFHWSGAGS